MSCNLAVFNGWGQCQSLLEEMIGSALSYKGDTWTTATALTASAWQTKIADDDKTVRNTLMLPILGFTKTTDEPEISTSTLGKKRKTKNSIPSGTLQLDASLCDYKHLHALEGRAFEFIPWFDGQQYWLTKKNDGTLKGFRARIAMVADLPPEDKLTSFLVHIFFDSYEEFKNVVVVNPSFNFDDVSAYSLPGIDVELTSAYATGDISVRATERGPLGTQKVGVTGLDQTTDWETMAVSSGTTLPAAVTAVAETGDGGYDLTVKKDTGGTPANLTASDTVSIQAHDDDATNLTLISHVFDVTGA